MRWTLNGLLDEYAGLLDGETSKSVDLSGKLTSFDISQLPDDGSSSNPDSIDSVLNAIPQD